jgi:hypothetical protein
MNFELRSLYFQQLDWLIGSLYNAIINAITWFLQLIGQAIQALMMFLAKAIGLDRAIIFFLVELPTSDINTAQASGDAQLIATANTMTKLYNVIEPIALYLLVIALFIAGIAYALESFRIIGEGTAFNILTNSIMTPILIIAFPYIYNAVIGIINTITLPKSYGGSGAILQDWTIAQLIGNAFNPAVNATHISPTEQFTNVLAGLFLNIIIMIMIILTIFSIAILGALRYLLIVALYVAMPIILVLRLIPITKGIADSLLEELIGLITSSLIVAIFLRTATELTSISSGGGGLVSQLMAIGALIASPLFIMLFSSKLGRLFRAVQSTVEQSVGTGLIIGTFGAGMIAGGITGFASGGLGLARGAGGFGTLGAMTSVGSRIVGWADIHGGKLGTFAKSIITPAIGLGATLPHATKTGTIGAQLGAKSASAGLHALKKGQIAEGIRQISAPITTIPSQVHKQSFNEGLKRQTITLSYAPLQDIQKTTTPTFEITPPNYTLPVIGKRTKEEIILYNKETNKTLAKENRKNEPLWNLDDIANASPEEAFKHVAEHLKELPIKTGIIKTKIAPLKDHIEKFEKKEREEIGKEIAKTYRIIKSALPTHRQQVYQKYIIDNIAKDPNTHTIMIAKGAKNMKNMRKGV